MVHTGSPSRQVMVFGNERSSARSRLYEWSAFHAIGSVV
jgi:hypothetical protein